MKFLTLSMAIFLNGCANLAQAGDEINKINTDQTNLTAERFLADFASPNAPTREAARLYLLGVLDATEGRNWCSYSTLKTTSINDFIFDKLRKKSPTELNLRAATLIVTELNKSFPCGAPHEANLPKTKK